MKTGEKIVKTMNTVTELLLKKNKNYGDSATNPRNIFAKGNAIENICARIDDKIARIENSGLTPEVYDTIDDLMGYLCLLKIAINDKDKKDFVPSGDYVTTKTGALSPTGSERKK
tara:strand:+ start:902 stop:1246 length:345 start_codon:yes stop_codon:yes gene_type:complete